MTYKKPPVDPTVDEDRTCILDPNGERILIGLRQDIPETLPTGERRYVRTTFLVPDANGTPIDPADPRLVRCQSCGIFPFHEDATRQCTQCEATICLGCAARLPDPEDPGLEHSPQYLCRNCLQGARRQARLNFWFSFQ